MYMFRLHLALDLVWHQATVLDLQGSKSWSSLICTSTVLQITRSMDMEQEKEDGLDFEDSTLHITCTNWQVHRYTFEPSQQRSRTRRKTYRLRNCSASSQCVFRKTFCSEELGLMISKGTNRTWCIESCSEARARNVEQCWMATLESRPTEDSFIEDQKIFEMHKRLVKCCESV